MDSASHAVWGSTLVRSPSLVGWAALAGLLPDLVPAVYGIVRYRWAFFRDMTNQSFADHPEHTYVILYRWCHSLLPISLITGVLLAFAPAWTVVAIPYYVHLLLDIPTHQGIWATRLFYPLSDAHIEGRDWWRHPWVSVGNWSVLVVVNLYFFLR